MKRVIVLALVGVLSWAGTAAAQTYPPGPTAPTVTDSTPGPGQTITATFTFDAGTSASGTLNSDPISLGTKTTDSQGKVSFTVTIPSTFKAGETHTVVASGTFNGQPLTQSVTLTIASASTGSGSLPRTGADSSAPLARAAAILVAGGAGLVYVARRRRTAIAA